MCKKCATIGAEACFECCCEFLRVNHAGEVGLSYVQLIGDNPYAGDAKNSIECFGAWTKYDVITFKGDTLIECLRAAVKMKQRVK